MGAKSRLRLLVLVMMSVALAGGGIAIFVLYRAAFEQQRVRLTDIARSQARLMEAVARFDAKYSTEDLPGGALAATLQQIEDAHSRLEGFAETGEFTLAKHEGERIVFLLNRRHDEIREPDPVPFSSELAEPMRQALSEELGGTVVGLDYRGETVLAAYEPVSVLGLGIVAKIDLEEVRKPFVKAGLLAGGVVLVLISFGAALFLHVGNPIVEQVRKSEERLNLALESAGVGTWDWNILENSITWDDYIHALFGLEPGMFSGGIEGFIDMLHPDDRERTKRAFARSVEEDAEYDTDYRVVWPDGSQHDLATRGKVYRDRKGRAVRMAGVVWDIIERKQAEENLRRTEEAKRRAQRQLLDQQRWAKERVEAELEKVRDELVRKARLAAVGQVSASIAHDLRNPLASVRNAAFYLARRVPKDEPELAEFLQIIENEVVDADRIIGSLLELTRSKPSGKQAVDLRQLVEDAFSRIKDTDGVRCRVSTDPDPFQIQADPDQFRQVLVNLAKNAVQAMEGKGELSIEASRSASCDVIVVRDTGPGIPGDVREELFEPLVTTKAKGTGLGLTICRQVVDRHVGTIELMENESPGAAFQISLPREVQSVDAE